MKSKIIIIKRVSFTRTFLNIKKLSQRINKMHYEQCPIYLFVFPDLFVLEDIVLDKAKSSN